MKYVKLFLILFITLIVITNIQAQTKKSSSKQVQMEEPAPPPPKDGVFIHISSGIENPHKVLMALSMALKMSADKDVYVYLDINAVNIVLNNSKSLEMPKFESSKIIIDKLIEKGVKVAVCPTCLEVANKTQFDLMKGIVLANKDDFFNFTQGRILSLSY